MREVTLLEMLQKGVHFGHQESRWHPKMKPYIFTSRNGIHIIDLEKTQAKLAEAAAFLKGIAKRGGVVLFVGTKRQAKDIVRSAAESVGMPSVTERWIGGLLTNFETIIKSTRKFKSLESQAASGEFAKYTKKEQLEFRREIERLRELVGGIVSLERLPDAVFFVDLRKEKTALAEARKMKVPTVAIADTNTNPEAVAYPIPANDDATKSIDLIVNLMAEAIREGLDERATEALAKEKAEVEAAGAATVAPSTVESAP